MFNSKTPTAPNLFFQYLMLLSIPLYAIGYFGTTAAAIWLICIGCWKIVLFGLLVAVISSFAFPFLIMPTALFMMLAGALSKYGKIYFAIGAILSSIYIAILSATICLVIMKYFIGLSTENSILPALFWAYATATFPFMRLTRQEAQSGDASSSIFSTFFIQLSLCSTIIFYYFNRDFNFSIILFCSIFFILTIIYQITTMPKLYNSLYD